MANYASLQDVKDALPQLRLGTTSRPSEARVEEILEEVCRELDGILGKLGYTVPVTGPLSVKILRGMVLYETTARVLYEGHAGIRNPDELGAARAHQMYLERVKALGNADDAFTLPDAVSSDEVVKFEAEVGSVVSEIGSADVNQRILRDQVF